MQRLFDIIFSLILIIILFIPLIIVGLIIRLDSNGKSIHWSKRIGKNSKVFYMPKFRTMFIGTPNIATHLMNDSENYITRIGSFLRNNSIDEIPQIISILIGDLSFIGPRPALFNQDDLVILRKKYGVDKIKPGLTGWAQVNGRDSITIEEKVELEREYIKKKNVLFDLYIIILTIKVLVSKAYIKH
tara:strand:+ start:1744 stop:2304 length:561 start_codon:yes stop_codon:yes gene_type:complete